MKTALATKPEERVYCPTSIDDARNSLPRKGGRIRIWYRREYVGTSDNEQKGKRQPMMRRAVIVQKCVSHFTVRLEPEVPRTKEEKRGFSKCGDYRVSFLYIDLVLGKVKVKAVEG